MQLRRAITFHLFVPLCTALLAACAPTRPLASAKDGIEAPCPTRSYWPTVAWRPLAPQLSRLDTVELGRLDRFVTDSMPNLYSLMVVQHGYVVAEQYWRGADSSTTFDLRSATKSVTSTVVGEELAAHALKGLDQRLSDFFPEYFRGQDPDSWKWRIKLRNLLTMTSGIEWAEGSAMMPEDVPESLFISLPMAERPGQKFNYNSGGIHLLSIAITRTTHKSVRDLAVAKFLGPIGIQLGPDDWSTDPHGNSFGGYGLWMTARNMARFGYLYLNDGCWEDRRVLPAGWVKEATAAQEDTPFGKGTYGYLWWRTTFDGHPAYFAGGWGGQHIVVVPTLDLVVVTTAVPEPTSITTDPLRLVRRFVVPATEGAIGG